MVDATATKETTRVGENNKAPEFSLFVAPKNQGEVLNRILEEEARLKIKVESLRGSGQTKQAEQVDSERDMQYRMGEHLAEIGRGYAREELQRLLPEFDYKSDESEWTSEEKEAMEWATIHADTMPVNAVLKRAEGYRPNLEKKFREEIVRFKTKELGLSQRRDLRAADNLIALLKTYQTKDIKS